MIVPQIQLTRVDGDTWLTLSATVDKSDAADRSVDDLLNLRRIMLDAPKETLASGGTLIETNDDRPESEWRDVVSKAVGEIRSSDLRKVVLARSVHGITSQPVNSFAVIRQLSDVHRDALIFGYWRDEKAFVGASPERLVQLDGRTISASSLAGTVARGLTPSDDVALAAELQSSEKDLAEHALVRDMLHDILSDVAENVSSPEVPEILTLSNVHHLHTEVRGELGDQYSLLDVVSRLHPTPAVGGTPRDEALAFISNNEGLDRGWYAAPIGWLDKHSGEFAVALRSGIIAGNEFALFAGCGIVADSDPCEELQESILKLEPMRAAIASSFDASENDIMMAAKETE
jgi:isochorismate synthase